MYTYYFLELAVVMFATSSVALAIEQLILVMDELDLLKHDKTHVGAYASDPRPRVSLLQRGYGNLTVRGCAWIKRVASPGVS